MQIFDGEIESSKKARRIFGRSSDTVASERSLVRACFSVCRAHFPRNVSLYSTVVAGVDSGDPVAARHVMALLHEYALESQAVAQSVRQFLPSQPSPAHANLGDTTARVLFVRICGLFAAAPGLDTRRDFVAALVVWCVVLRGC